MRRFDAWLLRNPWAGLLILGLVSGVMYEIASRLPYRTPYDIGPTWLDEHVPYLWWSVPFYMTYYFVLPTFAWLNQHTPAFVPLWRRALAYIVCNLAITIIIPTRVHPWALEQQTDMWARLVVSYDTPLAAIPSAHVGLPCCLWLCSRKLGGNKPMIFGIWTGVFALTILTTKQHYAWDLLAGLALAWVIAWVPFIDQTGTPVLEA